MPHHILTRAMPLLPCALLLTGCASSLPNVVEAPRLTVPASLLACAGQPEPPATEADDTVLAHWILDLAAAGDDCRGKLSAVAKVLDRWYGLPEGMTPFERTRRGWRAKARHPRLAAAGA